MTELSALYDTEYKAMIRLATLLCGSEHVAADVVHESFLRLYDKWDDARSPGAYLRRIVINESNSVHRRAALEIKHQPTPRTTCLPPDLDSAWEAIQQLPPKQRTVVVLRFYDDLTIEQIAEVTGSRAGTIKSRLHRALNSLRTRLDTETAPRIPNEEASQ